MCEAQHFLESFWECLAISACARRHRYFFILEFNLIILDLMHDATDPSQVELPLDEEEPEVGAEDHTLPMCDSTKHNSRVEYTTPIMYIWYTVCCVKNTTCIIICDYMYIYSIYMYTVYVTLFCTVHAVDRASIARNMCLATGSWSRMTLF